MRLIHISDLHIGKRVNEFSLIEDQKYILEQILSITVQEQADAMLLAGDIYDKTIPPIEAVQVLDAFFTRLAEEKIPVLAVSGNHDSAERLAFGAQLMSSRGIYLASLYDGKAKAVHLRDTYGEVTVHLLPFLKPSTVRHALDLKEIGSYQEALEAAVGQMEIDETQRNVLVAHQFVTGAKTCDSEEVMVGGLDQIPVSVFDRFDYVALGHIHSPQQVGRETVRYSGTPLKYSFSEAEQEKSVTLIEMKEKGTIRIQQIPLHPLRDMRKIRGSYMEVTALSSYQGTNTEDYVQITLTDEEDIPDGMQKLRVIYPNVMRLEYDNARTRENRMLEADGVMEEKTELELFEEFYELQNNQTMSVEQRRFVQDMIEELKAREERV